MKKYLVTILYHLMQGSVDVSSGHLSFMAPCYLEIFISQTLGLGTTCWQLAEKMLQQLLLVLPVQEWCVCGCCGSEAWGNVVAAAGHVSRGWTQPTTPGIGPTHNQDLDQCPWPCSSNLRPNPHLSPQLDPNLGLQSPGLVGHIHDQDAECSPTRDSCTHHHLPKAGGLGTYAHGSRCFGSSVCTGSLHIFFTTSMQVVLNRNVELQLVELSKTKIYTFLTEVKNKTNCSSLAVPILVVT